MTVCVVCGGSDFDLHDGHYYCNECNALIQNVGQRQEEEDEYCENVFTQLSISTSGGKKVKKAEKKKQLGEQWGTHQCFNIIICKQIEKLIELGASPQLKIVVFYLWAKYLKKCEVAFMGREADDNWLPRLGTVPLARDIIILYQGEKKLPNRYNKRKKNCENNDNPDDNPDEIVTENEMELSHEIVSQPEVSPESSLQEVEAIPVQKTKSNVVRRLRFNKEAEERQGKCNKKTITKTKKLTNYNDYMSIEKTAAFCYLGLLLTENNILLCDLIRWAREDHFPYVSVSYLLPSTMKLQSHDWRFITAYKVPELEMTNELAHKLAVFLDVDNLPERPLMPIIARFVIDINLPNELLPIIHKLLDGKLTSIHWKAAGIPKYELMAMSVIIIALKLLFGLNDDTERKLSIVGRELTALLPKELQPFIWEDWMKSTMFKLNFISHSHAPSAIFAESDLFRVDSFKTFYEKAIHGHWRPKETVLIKNYNATEFRDTLKKVFSDLNEIEEVAPICPATSFPLTSMTKYYKRANLADSALYSEDFSQYSLAYITNWKKYMHDPKLCDVYNCHLDSNAIFDNSDRLFDDELCILAHNQYWILHFTKNNPVDIPYNSFTWLLSMCSKYVEVSPEELYLEVMKMENAILNSSWQQKRLPQESRRMKQAASVRKSCKKRKHSPQKKSS